MRIVIPGRIPGSLSPSVLDILDKEEVMKQAKTPSSGKTMKTNTGKRMRTSAQAKATKKMRRRKK